VRNVLLKCSISVRGVTILKSVMELIHPYSINSMRLRWENAPSVVVTIALGLPQLFIKTIMARSGGFSVVSATELLR
jgi:hypothetical protein